jgi:[protein-PII] uridylyltransferase
VRHHLLMSETSQMRDLNDFKTILDFAAVVQSPERLKLLLILTIADIRAVGPGVWNGWKGQLLRTSISRPSRCCRAATARSRGATGWRRAGRLPQRMSDWSPAQLDRYMARHYDAYWLNAASTATSPTPASSHGRGGRRAGGVGHRHRPASPPSPN